MKTAAHQVRALDAHRIKAEFLDQLSHPKMAGFVQSWAWDRGRDTFPAWMTGETICADLAGIVRMSETFFVSQDISQVIEGAAEAWMPERVIAEDLPATHGFQVFERPWMALDVQGNTVPIRALVWARREIGRKDLGQLGQAGVLFWALSDLNDAAIDDYFRPDPVVGGFAGQDTRPLVRGMLDAGIRLLPYSIYAHPFGQYGLEFVARPGVSTMLLDDADPSETFTRAGDGQWLYDPGPPKSRTFTYRGKQTLLTDRLDGRIKVRPEPFTHFQQVLWRFMQQELPAIERPWVPKTTARMLMRRQMSTEPVTVLQLRRRASSEQDSGRSFHYSHQFLVRGHPRRQWYPSEGRHKSIWVPGYVKGPKDAPFLKRDHVIAVTR